MSLPIIEVKNLSKVYKLGTIGATSIKDEMERIWHRMRGVGEPPKKGEDFMALRDVSFSVMPGEVVGVIGRNGAGKSTLLKIISRITQQSTGVITLRGRVASLLEVGTGFHPDLSGRENIFLNGAILGMTKTEIRSRFDEIVAFAEVEKFIDTPVKRYSSGMYVRLAFAVAAHLQPEILIVDEVLAVGDSAFQKKCIGKMKDVSSNGRTVLFVSHNLAIIRNMCQKVVWLEKGETREVGNTLPVTDTYLRAGVENGSAFTSLREMQRPGGYGDRLRLSSVNWVSDLPLVHDGSAEVQINFDAIGDVDQLTVGIGFSSLDGTRLLTYETDLFGARRDIKAGQSGSVKVEFNNLPLAPGYYSVDIGCRSGEIHGVDYLPACMQVEVAPGPRTPGNLANAGAGVRIASDWQWLVKPKNA